MAALANLSAVHLGCRAVAGRKVTARKAPLAARQTRANVVTRAAATERKFNFSAGPACLPLDVLEEMKEDLVNYK
jgi:phosphoserine aminotransferase